MYLFTNIILKSVSLHSPGWPLICDNPPFSAFWVLRLQVFIITMAPENDTFVKIQLTCHTQNSLFWSNHKAVPTLALTTLHSLSRLGINILPISPPTSPWQSVIHLLSMSIDSSALDRLQAQVTWKMTFCACLLPLGLFKAKAYVDFIAFISESTVEQGDGYPCITRFSVGIAPTLSYHYQHCCEFRAQVLVRTHAIHSFECVCRSGRNCWVITTILGLWLP